MIKSDENCPNGFCGPVRTWSELLPPAERSLRLPRDLPQVALGLHRPDASAPSLQFDLIEVQSVTESMGRIEDALRALALRLADGGTLVLEFEHLQSLPRLRAVIEGRPGAFDPIGSIDDPAQALPLRRVLAAAAAAGLQILDVVAVPTPPGELAAGFAEAIFRAGFLPMQWLGGAPPARYWLICRQQKTLAGTVLIGSGDQRAQARTEANVRTFLPPGWEVQCCRGDHECAAWNRGIAAANGEVVWFLRAGAEADAATFLAASNAAALGPAAPGRDGVRSNAGDLSGLMLARVDLLLAGPLPADAANTQVALEDHGMRLETCTTPVQVVEGRLQTPPPPIESPATFEVEARALLDYWFPLTQGKQRHDSDDHPQARANRDRVVPWAGRKPRVSLCMIARDEEHFLPQCLQAAAGCYDELVLVDTGSKDRTVAIAESFGAKVLHRPWDDDFSAPRNFGLQAATGDWILVLDADELLVPGSAQRLRELVEDGGIAGYHMRFTNTYTGGKTLGVMMVRLFRNLPGVEYQNVIHEQMTPSLVGIGKAQGLIISPTDLEVVHHGYTDEVMGSRHKNERNERLFKKQLQQHPDDIYSLYKFGDFLRRVPGRGREARELLERCLELILAGPPYLPRELPYAGEAAALCALEYAREGRLERAREILDLGLRRLLPTPNLHYIAASLDLAAGRNDAAIAQFKRCLAYRGQVLVVPIQDGITGHVSIAGIAQAYLQKGDLERAQRLLEQAIAMQPRWEVSRLTLSRLHIVRGDLLAALHTLTEFLAAHPDSPGACQQTTMILQRLGLKDQAARMGKRAIELLEAGALDHEAEHMRKILATF